MFEHYVVGISGRPIYSAEPLRGATFSHALSSSHEPMLTRTRHKNHSGLRIHQVCARVCVCVCTQFENICLLKKDKQNNAPLLKELKVRTIG